MAERIAAAGHTAPTESQLYNLESRRTKSAAAEVVKGLHWYVSEFGQGAAGDVADPPGAKDSAPAPKYPDPAVAITDRVVMLEEMLTRYRVIDEARDEIEMLHRRIALEHRSMVEMLLGPSSVPNN